VRRLSETGECPDRQTDAGRPDGGILVDLSTLRCGKHDPGSKQSRRGRDRIGASGVGEAGARLTHCPTGLRA
jgi:hypothetical protein